MTLAGHELKYQYSFVNQNFLFMVAAVLKKKPNAATLRTLPLADVQKMLTQVIAFEGGVDKGVDTEKTSQSITHYKSKWRNIWI